MLQTKNQHVFLVCCPRSHGSFSKSHAAVKFMEWVLPRKVDPLCIQQIVLAPTFFNGMATKCFAFRGATGLGLPIVAANWMY